LTGISKTNRMDGIKEAQMEARIQELETQMKMAQEETDLLKVKIHETFKDTPVGYRIFGEALLNPEEQCHSIDEFLGKAKDYMLEDEETTEELEEEIGELKEKIEGLEEEKEEVWDELEKTKEEDEELKAEIGELKKKIEDATAREESMFQTLNKRRQEESDWALKKIEELKAETKKLQQFKSDVIEALQFDDDLDDEDYISSIKDMEAQYDANKDDEE
jgi:chromosome segregation ATPase